MSSDGTGCNHSRELAYEAVYTVIHAEPGNVYRNAIIWRAVHAALNAAGVSARG